VNAFPISDLLEQARLMNVSIRSRQQIQILLSMYFAYGAMMVCQQMITIMGPAMLADEALGLTKTNLGDIVGSGAMGALVGKLVWGPLCDKIGGRLTFMIGITLTALLTGIYGYSPNVAAFAAVFFLLSSVKSSGWAGLTKLVGNWYHPQQYGRIWAILSTSSRASVFSGTLFFGWLLGVMHWRYVAVCAALIALVVFAAIYFLMQERPADPKFIEGGGADASRSEEFQEESRRALENLRNHPLKETTLLQGLIAFAKSHRVWLVVIMSMMLTCLMAFLDFVGIYLMEVYELSPSNAALASSVFPLGSLCGLIASVALYGRFSKKALRSVLTLSLAVAAACILTLKFSIHLDLSEAANFRLALCSIFLFGFAISPSYYLPISIFSIEFGGPHSATLVCFFDAVGLGASATFGFVGGRLADSAGGWNSFMNLIVILVMIAMISMFAFMHAESKPASGPEGPIPRTS
jgi:OPA family sugar phosphate sensor protein UhpC-like MFS transporter